MVSANGTGRSSGCPSPLQESLLRSGWDSKGSRMKLPSLEWCCLSEGRINSWLQCDYSCISWEALCIAKDIHNACPLITSYTFGDISSSRSFRCFLLCKWTGTLSCPVEVPRLQKDTRERKWYQAERCQRQDTKPEQPVFSSDIRNNIHTSAVTSSVLRSIPFPSPFRVFLNRCTQCRENDGV